MTPRPELPFHILVALLAIVSLFDWAECEPILTSEVLAGRCLNIWQYFGEVCICFSI